MGERIEPIPCYVVIGDERVADLTQWVADIKAEAAGRATADAEARLAAVRAVADRADSQAHMNGDSYGAIVSTTDLRAALDPAPTTDADGHDERRDGAGGAS